MALVGLTSTATRTALGTSSRNSPSRLARTSEVKKLSGVAAWPGKAGDQTMRDRVSANAKGDRDRRGRSFGRPRRRIANRSDNGDATADEVGHERGQAIVLAAEPVVLDDHVLALYVARFAEALTKRGSMARGAIERPTADKANHRHGLLLRPRRERPRHRRAAEKGDETATVHSITSSARASSVGEISRPSTLAVVRLMVKSNLVGCSTGRSAGFAPRRILSTSSAARR